MVFILSPNENFSGIAPFVKSTIFARHIIIQCYVEHLKLTCLHEMYKTFNFCLKF